MPGVSFCPSGEELKQFALGRLEMVVQKRDGTSETVTPRELEQKYGFTNDPA